MTRLSWLQVLRLAWLRGKNSLVPQTTQSCRTVIPYSPFAVPALSVQQSARRHDPHAVQLRRTVGDVGPDQDRLAVACHQLREAGATTAALQCRELRARQIGRASCRARGCQYE